MIMVTVDYGYECLGKYLLSLGITDLGKVMDLVVRYNEIW